MAGVYHFLVYMQLPKPRFLYTPPRGRAAHPWWCIYKLQHLAAVCVYTKKWYSQAIFSFFLSQNKVVLYVYGAPPKKVGDCLWHLLHGFRAHPIRPRFTGIFYLEASLPEQLHLQSREASGFTFRAVTRFIELQWNYHRWIGFCFWCVFSKMCSPRRAGNKNLPNIWISSIAQWFQQYTHANPMQKPSHMNLNESPNRFEGTRGRRIWLRDPGPENRI